LAAEQRAGRDLKLQVARFVGLLLTALTLAPGLAHLLEMPHKLLLSRTEYLTVQQIYRGWALLGIVVIGALVSLLILTLMTRGLRTVFPLTLTALLCIAATQAVFWTFTFPANQETRNWTVPPEHWMALRAQWEYSHAASAVLSLIALGALILSVLVNDERR